MRKAFGDVQALRGVDLTVEGGEVFGFLGPNGAGKTTTIRILMGFIRADGRSDGRGNGRGNGRAQHGEARVLGLDAWRDTVEIKRRTGFLPDLISIGTGFTGRAFLDYIARLRGFSGPPPLQRELLDRLELADSALARRVKGYSTGMAKKLALVQAMQHDPELLIMDEPTEALDPLIRQVLFELLREARARGVTVFMSSHILSDVEEICERVALIRDGRIVKAGSVEDLREGRARTMVVELRTPPDGDFVVPGAQVLSRDGTTLRLAVKGDVNDVVRALARYDLTDLVYERLSLDELFLDFYGGNRGDGAAAGDAREDPGA
ncbi:MAG: ABC transporter ATP-binding protein [Chloroflexi bacterium]|nr:ABC transporter ATP-binding protein [Chloroflexota bacterium]